MKNKQLIFKEQPQGMPTRSTFDIQETTIRDLQENEVVIQSLYISVDPFMRGRMTNRKSYVDGYKVGEPISGLLVGKVTNSTSNNFKQDDLVTGMLPFQEVNVVSVDQLMKVETFGLNPSVALGPLGMTGLTAYFGMIDIGKPQKDETVVVSGAAGAVGQIAGQIAKKAGAYVVGIVGSKEKKEYILNELGFDAAVEYKNGNVEEQLKEVCPNGIDVYFDNVGGEIADAVLPLLNTFARVPVCGSISSYNLENEKADVGLRVQRYLTKTRALMQGFLITDFLEQAPRAYKYLSQAILNGELKYRETIWEGFDSIPEAFIGLFTGTNIGKQLVKIDE